MTDSSNELDRCLHYHEVLLEEYKQHVGPTGQYFEELTVKFLRELKAKKEAKL